MAAVEGAGEDAMILNTISPTRWVTDKVTYAEEWWGPADAKAALARRPDNQRTTRPEQVSAYARDMLTPDAWVDNGETCKFDETGAYVDGQHRALAIIESGVTIKMHVVTGLPVDAIATIDQGLPRRVSDAFKIKGVAGSTELPAVLRRLHFWERGIRTTRGKGSASHRKVTVAEMLTFLERHEQSVREALEQATKVKKKRMLSLATAAAAFYLFAEKDQVAAEEFWEMLVTGRHLGDGNPIAPLRDRLFASKSERRSEDEKLCICIRAWNHWRERTPTDRLVYMPGNTKLSSDTMPEPK